MTEPSRPFNPSSYDWPFNGACQGDAGGVQALTRRTRSAGDRKRKGFPLEIALKKKR
jgi:hypothetical protein